MHGFRHVTDAVRWVLTTFINPATAVPRPGFFHIDYEQFIDWHHHRCVAWVGCVFGFDGVLSAGSGGRFCVVSSCKGDSSSPVGRGPVPRHA